MAITNVLKVVNQRQQFRDVFENVIVYEATWDPDSILSNSEFHESVAVPGAKMGDFVLTSVDIDLQDMDLNGQVESNGSVRVGVHNLTAGAINLGVCHLHIIVLSPVH